MANPKKKTFWIIVIALSVVLLVVHAVLWWPKFDGTDNFTEKYPYLSKRLAAENQNDLLINFTPLREAMRDYIGEQSGNVGAYFEYLPTGTSIGVNDQMEIKIASLVKIPVVMAIYKAAEEGKLDLKKELTIDPEDLDKSFGNLYKRGAGAKISIMEATDLMLKESDNTAARVLTDELPEFAIENVFDSLDIRKEKEDGFAVISPKSYTSILRSLYLSSYVNREHSNTILETLTETDFTDKLPAGVPQDILVSHKIGVFDQDSQHPVYSDCGIVYAPNRPYTLCIMTRDMNESISRKHMQLLSRMVYGYVAQAD